MDFYKKYMESNIAITSHSIITVNITLKITKGDVILHTTIIL